MTGRYSVGGRWLGCAATSGRDRRVGEAEAREPVNLEPRLFDRGGRVTIVWHPPPTIGHTVASSSR